MINFKTTQDSKPIITVKDGVQIVDFLIKDIMQSNVVSDTPIITDYFLVTEEDAMRPDTISQKMYGGLTNIEGILKFNNISNPFSIDVNDILYVYDVPSMNKKLRGTRNATKNERDDVRNQYLTPEKKSTADPQLKDFDNRNDARKPVEKRVTLPPNYANFGDTEVQVKNGKIVFGGNVTKQYPDCEQPLSKSEFISRLIKNRLNNK